MTMNQKTHTLASLLDTTASLAAVSDGQVDEESEPGLRHARLVCRSCGRRPALACVRGTWRVVKHHDVCRQCWRSVMDSRRAAKVAEAERARTRPGRTSKPSRARWGGGTDSRLRARP